MSDFNEIFKTADWTQEKHVPVIEAPDSVVAGEAIQVAVCVGKEIAHPNTTPHHIRWITLFFQPDEEKFPYQIGKAEFSAHGESAAGPDSSTVYTDHSAVFSFKTEKSGTIFAASFCNIHGLWQSTKKVSVA
jgi:superoxide reductase